MFGGSGVRPDVVQAATGPYSLESFSVSELTRAILLSVSRAQLSPSAVNTVALTVGIGKGSFPEGKTKIREIIFSPFCVILVAQRAVDLKRY